TAGIRCRAETASSQSRFEERLGSDGNPSANLVRNVVECCGKALSAECHEEGRLIQLTAGIETFGGAADGAEFKERVLPEVPLGCQVEHIVWSGMIVRIQLVGRTDKRIIGALKSCDARRQRRGCRWNRRKTYRTAIDARPECGYRICPGTAQALSVDRRAKA